MIAEPCYQELIHAKRAIDYLHSTKPALYNKFFNLIQLTRQLQYGYQYMGALIMDEESTKCCPTAQDDYVLSIYLKEIEKVKADNKFEELKSVLASYKKITYTNISKLVLGDNPSSLVGPIVVR